MSLYLLDTNVISQFVKSKASRHAIEKLRHLHVDDVCTSIVSYAEVLFGLVRAGRPPRLSQAVENFFQTVTVRDWDENTAHAYAGLRAASSSQGITIAPLDLMIAAQALAAGAVLVTNDSAMKRLTPWLPVEDWTA